MKKLLILGVSAILFSACSGTTNTTATTDTTPTMSPETTSPTQESMMPSPSPTSSPLASSSLMPNVPAMLTISLLSQNNSGQQGTAVLTPTKDGKVNVTLNMQGGNFTTPQPAHIHVGSCPKPGAVKYPLKDVVNGKSSTDLTVTMDELKALAKGSSKLAINVHKSATELDMYTACGDIKI